MQEQVKINKDTESAAKDQNFKPEMLAVSVSPHVFSSKTTSRIMLDVIISLLPAFIAGCIIFGLKALLLTAVCIASAVLSEFLFNVVCKREQSVYDLSAAVTGMLLALNLPADTPVWQAVIGSAFAIIFVKCLFGGIGQNFANPAITARIFMLVSFSSLAKASFPVIVDTAASATPLAILKGAEGTMPSILDLFFGVHGGAIGETCVLALLIGGIYLICRGIISWHTPVAFIATAAILTLIIGRDPLTTLQYTLSGGLFLGAFFMATDYATTPTTPSGRALFGFGCGVITVLIRFFGSYPEGVSFAILLMNILTPYIDKLTARKTFGVGGAKQ